MRYQLNLRVDQRDKVALDLELIDVPEHIEKLPLKPCHTYCVILPMKSRDKHVDVPSFSDGLVIEADSSKSNSWRFGVGEAGRYAVVGCKAILVRLVTG